MPPTTPPSMAPASLEELLLGVDVLVLELCADVEDAVDVACAAKLEALGLLDWTT